MIRLKLFRTLTSRYWNTFPPSLSWLSINWITLTSSFYHAAAEVFTWKASALRIRCRSIHANEEGIKVLQASCLMAFLSASTSNFTATYISWLQSKSNVMSQRQNRYIKYTLSRWTWRSIRSMYWSDTSNDLLIVLNVLHVLVGFAGRFQLHFSAVLHKYVPSFLPSTAFQQWTIQANTMILCSDLPSWCWKQQPSVRFSTTRQRLKTSLSDPSNLFQHTQPTSSPGICVAHLTLLVKQVDFKQEIPARLKHSATYFWIVNQGTFSACVKGCQFAPCRALGTNSIDIVQQC